MAGAWDRADRWRCKVFLLRSTGQSFFTVCNFGCGTVHRSRKRVPRHNLKTFRKNRLVKQFLRTQQILQKPNPFQVWGYFQYSESSVFKIRFPTKIWITSLFLNHLYTRIFMRYTHWMQRNTLYPFKLGIAFLIMLYAPFTSALIILLSELWNNPRWIRLPMYISCFCMGSWHCSVKK